jgi:hypothetical protein
MSRPQNQTECSYKQAISVILLDLAMQELPQLLADVTLATRRTVRPKHDRAPGHVACNV